MENKVTRTKPFAHVRPFTSRIYTMAEEWTWEESTEDFPESGVIYFPDGSTVIDNQRLIRMRLGLQRAKIVFQMKRTSQERLGPCQTAQVNKVHAPRQVILPQQSDEKPEEATCDQVTDETEPCDRGGECQVKKEESATKDNKNVHACLDIFVLFSLRYVVYAILESL